MEKPFLERVLPFLFMQLPTCSPDAFRVEQLYQGIEDFGPTLDNFTGFSHSHT
jgi:hypothetical protein